MSAHTPGPWVVYTVRRHSGAKGGDGSIRDAATSGRIARVHERFEDHGARAANARLIAAAPDLLAALKNAVAQMESLATYAERPGMSRSDIAIARAAIAKATGGTP